VNGIPSPQIRRSTERARDGNVPNSHHEYKLLLRNGCVWSCRSSETAGGAVRPQGRKRTNKESANAEGRGVRKLGITCVGGVLSVTNRRGRGLIEGKLVGGAERVEVCGTEKGNQKVQRVQVSFFDTKGEARNAPKLLVALNGTEGDD